MLLSTLEKPSKLTRSTRLTNYSTDTTFILLLLLASVYTLQPTVYQLPEVIIVNNHHTEELWLFQQADDYTSIPANTTLPMANHHHYYYPFYSTTMELLTYQHTPLPLPIPLTEPVIPPATIPEHTLHPIPTTIETPHSPPIAIHEELALLHHSHGEWVFHPLWPA
jgi:hypothetical protein